MHTRLAQTLKDAGYSATRPRARVFDELAKSGPVTSATLSQQCADTLDRATVYRTVTLFEQLGIVNRIWHGFKSQIELSEIFTPHHHHAVCLNCGRSIDITSPELESAVSSVSRKANFLAIGHVVELTGYCADCQQT